MTDMTPNPADQTATGAVLSALGPYQPLSEAEIAKMIAAKAQAFAWASPFSGRARAIGLAQALQNYTDGMLASGVRQIGVELEALLRESLPGIAAPGEAA